LLVPVACNLISVSDRREELLPDVTFLISDLTGAEEAEKLELALTRLEFVDLVNVDSDKGLVAVSYEGGETELGNIEGAIEEAGYAAEPSPGADPDVD
jgi:copper chaperone CopZ